MSDSFYKCFKMKDSIGEIISTKEVQQQFIFKSLDNFFREWSWQKMRNGQDIWNYILKSLNFKIISFGQMKISFSNILKMISIKKTLKLYHKISRDSGENCY
jgi:hypothetical protein